MQQQLIYVNKMQLIYVNKMQLIYVNQMQLYVNKMQQQLIYVDSLLISQGNVVCERNCWIKTTEMKK